MYLPAYASSRLNVFQIELVSGNAAHSRCQISEQSRFQHWSQDPYACSILSLGQGNVPSSLLACLRSPLPPHPGCKNILHAHILRSPRPPSLCPRTCSAALLTMAGPQHPRSSPKDNWVLPNFSSVHFSLTAPRRKPNVRIHASQRQRPSHAIPACHNRLTRRQLGQLSITRDSLILRNTTMSCSHPARTH